MENKTTKYGDYFNIPNEKFTPSKTSLDENHTAVLELKAFAKPPVIDFRRVLVGKNKSRPITLINPYEQDVQVQIEKLPTKKNFSVCSTDFTIQALQERTLTITWAPEQAHGIRELVVLRVNDSIRLQFIMLGQAVLSTPDLKKLKHPGFHSPLRCTSNIGTPSRKAASQASTKPLTVPQSPKLSASCGRIRTVGKKDYFNCLTDAKVNNVRKDNMIEQVKLRNSCRRRILAESKVNNNVKNVEKKKNKKESTKKVDAENISSDYISSNDDERSIYSHEILSDIEMSIESSVTKGEGCAANPPKEHETPNDTDAPKEIDPGKGDLEDVSQLKEEFLEDGEMFFKSLEEGVGGKGGDDDEIRRQTFVKTPSQPEILHQIYDNFNNSGFDAVTVNSSLINEFGGSIDDEKEDTKMNTNNLNSNNWAPPTCQSNTSLFHRDSNNKGWLRSGDDVDDYDYETEDESALDITVISNPNYSKKYTASFNGNNNKLFENNKKTNNTDKNKLKNKSNNSQFLKEKPMSNSIRTKKTAPHKANRSGKGSVKNIKLMNLQSVEELPRMRWSRTGVTPDVKTKTRSNSSGGGGKFIKDKTILNSCFTRKYPVSPFTKPCLERKNCIKYRHNFSASNDDLSSYATCMASYGNDDSCGDKRYLRENIRNLTLLDKKPSKDNQYNEDTLVSKASSFKTCSENFFSTVAFPKESADESHFTSAKHKLSFSDISSNTLFTTNLKTLRTGTYTKLDNDNIYRENETLDYNELKRGMPYSNENDIDNLTSIDVNDQEENNVKTHEDDFYNDSYEEELNKLANNEMSGSKEDLFNVSHIEGEDEVTCGYNAYKIGVVKDEDYCTEDMVISPLMFGEDLKETNYDIFYNCPVDVLKDDTSLPPNRLNSVSAVLPGIDDADQKKTVEKCQKKVSATSLEAQVPFRSINPLVASVIYKKPDNSDSRLNINNPTFSKCENVLKNTILNLQSCIKHKTHLKINDIICNDEVMDYEKKVLDWKIGEPSRMQNKPSHKIGTSLSFKKSANILIKKNRNVVLVNRSKWRSPLQHRNEQIPKSHSCESNQVVKRLSMESCRSSNNDSTQSIGKMLSSIHHTFTDKFKSFHTDRRSTIHRLLSNDKLSSQGSNKTLNNASQQACDDRPKYKEVKTKPLYIRSNSDDSRMSSHTLNRNFSSSKHVSSSSSDINLYASNIFKGSSANLNYKPKKSYKHEIPDSFTCNMASKESLEGSSKSSLSKLAKKVFHEEHRITGFSKWMNFVFNPLDLCDADEGKRGTRSKSSERDLTSSKSSQIRVATWVDEEYMKLDRAVEKVWKRLRGLVAVVEKEVSAEKLSFRADRPIFFHAALKEQLINLLLAYNHIWLVMGLNVVFETDQHHNPNNIPTSAIVKCINDHFFSPPSILKAYSHESDKNSYKEGFQAAINGHIIVKFLSLVLLLDRCKTQKVIFFDPCLFNKNSKYKSSMDILKQFSKLFLRKEGDIIKHLSYIKYHVTYLQTSLAETDYRVVDVQNDLKDGIRLSRLLQLLSQSWQLGSQMHAPFSYKNRLHNMTQIMTELSTRGISVKVENSEEDISAEDIITGNLDATMELVWKICLHFQIKALLDEDVLQAELKHLTYILQSAAKKDHSSTTIIDFKDLPNNFCLVALMNWCRLVCGIYQIKIVDTSVSFWDGRALCYLLHHYYPDILPDSLIQNDTLFANRNSIKFNEDGTVAERLEDLIEDDLPRKKIEEMIDNEVRNYYVFNQKLAVLGGVPALLSYKPFEPPNQKLVVLFLSFLSNRILASKGSLKATTALQRWWKGVLLQKEVAKRTLKEKNQETDDVKAEGLDLTPVLQSIKEDDEEVVDCSEKVLKEEGNEELHHPPLCSVVDCSEKVVKEKRNEELVVSEVASNGVSQININNQLEEKVESIQLDNLEINIPESIKFIKIEMSYDGQDDGQDTLKSVEHKVDEKPEVELPALDFNEVDKHIGTEMLSPRNNVITKYKKNPDMMNKKDEKSSKKKVVGFDEVVHIVGDGETADIIKDSSIFIAPTRESSGAINVIFEEDSVTKSETSPSQDESSLGASTSQSSSVISKSSSRQMQKKEFIDYVKMLVKSKLNSEDFSIDKIESDLKMGVKFKGASKKKTEKNKELKIDVKIDSKIEMYDEKKMKEKVSYLKMKENKEPIDYITNSIPKLSECLEGLNTESKTLKNLKDNYMKDSIMSNENSVVVMHGDFTSGLIKLGDDSDERGEFEEELMMIEVLRNELKMREKELLQRLEKSHPKAKDKEVKDITSSSDLLKQSSNKRSILNPTHTENYVPIIIKPTLKVRFFKDASIMTITKTLPTKLDVNESLVSSTNTVEEVYSIPTYPRRYPNGLSSLEFTSEAQAVGKSTVLFMDSSVLEVMEENSKMSAFPSTTDSKVSTEKSEYTIGDETENDKDTHQATSNATESGFTSSQYRSLTEKTNSKTADEENTDKSYNDDGELSKDESDQQTSSDVSRVSSNESSNEKEKTNTKSVEENESEEEKEDSDASEASDTEKTDESDNLMIEKLGILFLKHLKKRNKKHNSGKSYDSTDSTEDSKDGLDAKIKKKLNKLIDLRLKKHNKAKNNSKRSKNVSKEKIHKKAHKSSSVINKTVLEILEKKSAFDTGVNKFFFQNIETALWNNEMMGKKGLKTLIEEFMKSFEESYRSMMVVKIQSAVRGWLTRRKFKATREFTKSLNRSQLGEYKTIENDIGSMQDLAMKYLTKKIEQQKLISIFLLQTFIRASMLKKEPEPTNTTTLQNSTTKDHNDDTATTSKKQNSVFKIRDLNVINTGDIEDEQLSESPPEEV